ncbi:ABC-type glycerol-3-phosphate transport system substrate-binding protein [Paenibacillus rhizosphaerae]|uniref:ABC-type glycerol-3-phosphate transport system substrate-binding protein n=1 Tax=Paenibacillus rhizosphaerae TaxID=297318 RepID=A0A839TNW2_9BACL|nr:extracellular solute-binding protein [Paenibacillus rhizosphaerae]MBB3127049.1 ABC-type glycerol-3-phosphate transport system substrate-binding protein [Paenibacillus rhizosphaerae]
MKIKVTANALAAILAAGLLLTACSSNSGNSSEPSPSTKTTAATEGGASSEVPSDNPGKIGIEPLKYSWFPNYDWWNPEPYDPNSPTQRYIKEQLMIEVQGISPNGNAKQKLSTMIASTNLPDVITLERSDANKMGKEGALVPLNAYYDKYPNLKKAIGEDTLNLLKAPDGNIYGIPSWYTGDIKAGNSGWWINRKIYKELGSPKLVTFDDLYNYLNMVKAKYPDVTPVATQQFNEGLTAITGLVWAGMKEGIVGDFARAVHVFAVPEGNELKPLYANPDYIEAQKYVSKLFRERLLSQDTLTQKQDQIKEKLKTGKIAVYTGFGVVNDASEADRLLRGKNPNDGYDIVWPFVKPGVDQRKIVVIGYNKLGWNYNSITKSAKEPERIFAWYDYATSPENSRTLIYGPQGLYWDKTTEDGAPIPNDKFLALKPDELQKLKLDAHPNKPMPIYVPWDRERAKYLSADQQDIYGDVVNNTVADTSVFFDINPPVDAPEGLIQQNVVDIATKTTSKALFAKDDQDVEAILSQGLDDLNKAGYDKLLKYKTEKWQEHVKQLGK